MPTVRLFKVGADPEFGFLDENGEVVEAHDVMSTVRTKFGLDGCSSISEMRPDPSINPSQVVQNLYSDFLKGYYANPDIRNLYWKAGSVVGDELPTGGHIHFGIASAITKNLYGGRIEYYRKLVMYLDTYLAQTVRLLDAPQELRYRINGDYGFLGDFRANGHGLEYRVLGSWLTSPRIAEGVLCLAQAIVYQHMWMTVHKKNIDLGNLPPGKVIDCGCEANEQECECEMEYDENMNVTKSLKLYRKKFPMLRDNIRRFKLYKQHELPIEFLFQLIEKNKTWFPGKDVDMKQAWGITSLASPKNVTLPEKILPTVKFDDIWKRAEK